jgi:hypothetical protein
MATAAVFFLGGADLGFSAGVSVGGVSEEAAGFFLTT